MWLKWNNIKLFEVCIEALLTECNFDKIRSFTCNTCFDLTHTLYLSVAKGIETIWFYLQQPIETCMIII